MENPMLKATAQPFQPGKPSAPRPANGFQPAPANEAPGAGTRNGDPGGFLPPHVLLQIQNQIGGGSSPRQGGMMPPPMSAQSRPFVPGMPQPQLHHHQQMPGHHMPHPSMSAQQHQQLPFQPPLTSPVLSCAIPPRLGHGHGMNSGSVQLTGLQAFLGGPRGLPPTINPNAQPHHMNGPASPMVPGLQPPSPFMFPSGPAAMGPPRSGKHRKGRSPAPITPLKTTGHNSTPSVSLNPAAFAASLAAAKARKKVVITIPKEAPVPGDEELLFRELDDELTVAQDGEEDVDKDAAEERRQERVKLRTAKEAAEIRSKWILREPLVEIDLSWSDEMLEDARTSCAIYPEPWPSHLGLPDTIDIYLPGLNAWDGYQDIRMDERLLEAEAEAQAQAQAHALAQKQMHMKTPEADKGLPFSHAWMLEPPSDLSLQISAASRSKSMAIPSPSDANMANFRLNRYLTSQDNAEGDPNLLVAEPAKTSSVARFQDALPLKLREAFAKRQAEGIDAKARNASGHGYTMSLGMPSSGGPFGPAALSALDMVRANSDAGPTEPALGDRPIPDKEISEPDLGQRGSSESSLAGIDEVEEEGEYVEGEEDEEEGDEGVRHKAAGKPAGWKELARGFGYDFDADGDGDGADEATPRLPSTFEGRELRQHSRQASRISVSTSRQGGVADGQEGDDELEEVCTNPSEDADASDFEEEIDSEVADGHHWSRRTNSRKRDLGAGQKRQGGGYYDDLSDMSDDDEDNLRDSLTPSDEQYSNPSDEEAAREERLMRRQHRAALRAARHETRRRRARSGTNNTLPSSSIGAADGLEHNQLGASKQSGGGWPHHAGKSMGTRGRGEPDIISNPSDELQSDDFDEHGTFGGPIDHYTSGQRLSQDFRFPAPSSVERGDGTHGGNDATASPFQFRPPRSDTLGRAAGSSFLGPGAKDFSFGRPNGAAAFDAHEPQEAANANGAGPNGQQPHFRLPSINNSSFGSSTFGDVGGRAQPKLGPPVAAAKTAGLNAAAPSFTPGSFTFTAPGAARLEMPASNAPASSFTQAQALGGVAISVEGDERGAQGREKRQKFGPLDSLVEDDEYLRPASPPRLKGSTATIEGPMRDFGSLSRRGPPPFNASGLAGQRTASGSRFKPDAPIFTPSWSRSTSLAGSSTRRPGLPDFGFGAIGESSDASSAEPTFALAAERIVAIPIRRPDEGWNPAQVEQQPQQQQRRPSGLSATRDKADVPSNEADLARQIEDEEGAMGASSAADPERTPMASNWDRARSANQPVSAHFGRSPPVSIPRPPVHDHRGMALPVPIDAHPMSRKQRIIHQHSLSRDSAAPSEDSRPRRSVHHAQQPNSFDTDDESLSDFIEELAERMDKALEGWAGKILDEVTIMGQVRPIHRPASDVMDKDQMIESFTQRVESLMDFYVGKVEKTAASRQSLDNGFVGGGDDSQKSIKAINGPQRHRGLDSLDAAGELDFDYVQEILDVKMQNLKDELKRTFTETLSARDQSAKERSDAKEPSSALHEPPALALSTETSEQLASLLSARLSSAFNDQARHQSNDFKVQLSAVFEMALEELTAQSQNKAAADRLETAHLVVDQIKANLDSLDRAVVEMRSSLGDHVQMALMNGLIPHLETLRTEPVDGDLIAARVTEILAPMISDEREQRRAEKRQSDESVRSPSFSAEAVAEETLSKLVPIVSSLKSEPVDSDALVARLSEVIDKQSIEHLVDLSPVIALLEPIIAKQEDIRSFTKKMIERQEEVERTMSELPGAINAKTEIFLSAAGQTQDASTTILSRVENLRELLQAKDVVGKEASNKEVELAEQLQSSRQEVGRLESELEAAGAALSAVKDDRSSSQVELVRAESRLDEAERGRDEALAQAEALRTKEADSLARAVTSEGKLLQAELSAHEAQLARDAANKEAAALKAHVEQLTIELSEAREERARERETAAQATAEALARAERAEQQASEAEKRANERVDASLSAERKGQESLKEAVERAAKAEGQTSSLEKRVTDLDAKVVNLQALSAAQKQKTAMNQQKLSGAEKRARDFDVQARDLAVAAARLEELEDRVKDDEELRDRLRDAQDGEARLRDEVAQYHARFSELEKDLITMKESLVGRNELEACQNDLAQSREEVARLKGRLAERERQTRPDGWVEVSIDQARSGTWSSMHAPSLVTPRLGSDQRNKYGLGQDTTASSSADTSGEQSLHSDDYVAVHHRPAATRSMSIASSVLREVEQDDGGWWS